MEPEVNLEKWINSDKYRFAKTAEMSKYLNGLESLDAKVDFYERTIMNYFYTKPIYSYDEIVSNLKGFYTVYLKSGTYVGGDLEYVNEKGKLIPKIEFNILPPNSVLSDNVIKLRFEYWRKKIKEGIVLPKEIKLALKIKPIDEAKQDFLERYYKAPLREQFVIGEKKRIESEILKLQSYQKSAYETAIDDVMQIKLMSWNWREIISLVKPYFIILVAYYYSLAEYLVFINDNEKVYELINREKYTQKKTISVLPYKWLGKESELEELYKYIDSSLIVFTKIEDFKAIFSGKLISHLNKIKWNSGNASELLYFMQELINRGLVEGNKKRFDYVKLKTFFSKPDNSDFKESFKNLKQGLDTDLGVKNKEKIDKIIESLL